MAGARLRVDLRLHDHGARAALREAEARALNLSPVWKQIGEHMLRSINKTFEAEGRPNKWAALHPQYKAQRPAGGILRITRRLQLSVTRQGAAGNVFETGSDHVTIGTNVVYAAIHQFGGTTAAHVIRPRNKKALAWPGGPGPRKSVNHPGSKIPARPFLVVQDEDYEAMAEILVDHVVGSRL